VLKNQKMTFENMVARFGEVTAYQYLEQIECAARIQPQRFINNPETRLANALRAQDAPDNKILAA
jgi:hypothetical protein